MMMPVYHQQMMQPHPMFMAPGKKVGEKPGRRVIQSLTEEQVNALNE
jgi:hypothetical protein